MTCNQRCAYCPIHCRPPRSEADAEITSITCGILLFSAGFIATGLFSAIIWHALTYATPQPPWGWIGYAITQLVLTTLWVSNLAITIYHIHYAITILPHTIPAARRNDAENLRRWHNGQKPIYLGKP